jgi:hypothetical protein
MTSYNDDIAEGLKAFASLQRSGRRAWEKWKLVGAGLVAGRDRLAAELVINDLDNKIWKKAYSLWLKESGYHAVSPEVRSRLFKIMEVDNLSRIEKWIQTLSEKQRMRWNHPASIWTNWQKHVGTVNQPRPIIISMAVDASGRIRQRVTPLENVVKYGANSTHYMGLIYKIVACLAESYKTSEDIIFQKLETERRRLGQLKPMPLPDAAE